MFLTLLYQVSFWPNSWVPLEAIQAVAQNRLHNASFNFSPRLPDSLAGVNMFRLHSVLIFENIRTLVIMSLLDTNFRYNCRATHVIIIHPWMRTS